jgi:uncharacterized protein (TIGR02246 family)
LSPKGNRLQIDEKSLRALAANYTAAWCSQNAASVASFFAQEGSLAVNGGPPAVGRTAITATAQSFMTAFPDLRVQMDNLVLREDSAVHHWTLTGTNTGPDGTGNYVQISGFEVWKIGEDGLIAESQGQFDNDEYQRQLQGS